MRKAVIVAVLASMMVLLAAPAVMAQVETHGFVQIRTLATDGPNSAYKTRIDRLGIRFTEVLNEDMDYLAEIYIHPPLFDVPGVDVVYMESAYLNWDLSDYTPWNFSIRFGKGRNFTYGIAPSYGNRRTSDYTLFSEAFTQSRVLGLQTFSTFGENINLAVGILNGYRPVEGGRSVPDFPIGQALRVSIGDSETPSSLLESNNKRVALSSRLGWMNDMINVGASGYVTQTGPQDTNTISRFGLDGEIIHPTGLMAQGQVAIATTAIDLKTVDTDADGVPDSGNGVNEEISHSGGEIMAGYEKDQLGLYARYGMLMYDDDNLRDMNQVMLSAIYKIHPRVHLRLEGLINGEETDSAKGWNDIDNNVVFFETLLAW